MWRKQSFITFFSIALFVLFSCVMPGKEPGSIDKVKEKDTLSADILYGNSSYSASISTDDFDGDGIKGIHISYPFPPLPPFPPIPPFPPYPPYPPYPHPFPGQQPQVGRVVYKSGSDYSAPVSGNPGEVEQHLAMVLPAEPEVKVHHDKG